MLNLDNILSNKNKNKDNNWPFRMLTIGPSGTGKTNTLRHLINDLHPIDKIYLYDKDLSEPKYDFFINKREEAGIKNLNDPHAFIEYSDDMDDVLDDNKNRDKKVLIVLNSTHYILMKIGNKKELKSIAEEKSGHLDYKDFLKMYNYCMRESYSFMTIDARPTATISFQKNFDEPLINNIKNDS